MHRDAPITVVSIADHITTSVNLATLEPDGNAPEQHPLSTGAYGSSPLPGGPHKLGICASAPICPLFQGPLRRHPPVGRCAKDASERNKTYHGIFRRGAVPYQTGLSASLSVGVDTETQGSPQTRLAHSDTGTVEVFSESPVVLCQSTELELRHGLFVRASGDHGV